MLDLQADWVFYLLRPEQLVASNIAVFFDRVIVVCLIKCFLLLQRHNMLILNPLIQICIRLACDFIVWVVGLVTLLEQYSQVALVESISIASRELDLFIKALHFGESFLDKSLGNLSISVCLIKQLWRIKTFVCTTNADLIFQALKGHNISACIDATTSIAVSHMVNET